MLRNMAKMQRPRCVDAVQRYPKFSDCLKFRCAIMIEAKWIIDANTNRCIWWRTNGDVLAVKCARRLLEFRYLEPNPGCRRRSKVIRNAIKSFFDKRHFANWFVLHWISMNACFIRLFTMHFHLVWCDHLWCAQLWNWFSPESKHATSLLLRAPQFDWVMPKNVTDSHRNLSVPFDRRECIT